MNIIEQIEQEEIARLTEQGDVPEFGPGDTLRVHVRVVEGSRERIQVFEGVCIARKNAGVNSAFTVRKISYGEGVERVFPLYSPRIDQIEVVRRGAVRRAKLYYLRGLRGKKARIAEKVERRVGASVANVEDTAAVAADIVPPPAPEETAAPQAEATADAAPEASAADGDGKETKQD